MSLTKQQRDALKDDEFAVPGKRKLPIHDEKHVNMAWDMVDNTKDLTDEERKEARSRILKKAHELGIDTKNWNIKASMQLRAMSLNVPVTEDHPNKMPFSGVLTKVDELSDAPPSGANGKLVMLKRDAVKAALGSLLGMAVDLSEDADDHDPQKKIGIITGADLPDNSNEVQIEGFIYASDFPDEAEYIQAHKDDLGFSYEIKRVYVASLDDPTLTVTGLTFTGAAILKKKDAAYTSTSLSAHAEEDIEMNKEEMQAILKPFQDQLTALAATVDEVKKAAVAAPNQNAASVANLVNPHSTAIRAAADNMEKAGMGLHPSRGHVKQLRAMADCMDAEAVHGKLPHSYDSGSQFYAAAEPAGDQKAAAAAAVSEALKPVTQQLDALKTQLGDLSAKAFSQAPAPERKTLPPSVAHVLQKVGLSLDASGDKKLTVAEVDKALKASGITDISARANFKTQLAAAGLLAN
jgi:hypothetical protein